MALVKRTGTSFEIAPIVLPTIDFPSISVGIPDLAFAYKVMFIVKKYLKLAPPTIIMPKFPAIPQLPNAPKVVVTHNVSIKVGGAG